MNAYEKLINEIVERIASVADKIRMQKDALTKNTKELKLNIYRRDNIESEINYKHHQISLLENFDKLISASKKFHIRKAIKKIMFIVILTTAFGVLAIGSVPVSVAIIAGVLAGLGVIGYEAKKYSEETYEARDIHDSFSIAELKDDLHDLEKANQEYAVKINSLIAKEYELKDRIERLTATKKELIINQGVVSARRDALIMSMIADNQDKFDEAFASDQRAIDILKLERKIKEDGENV